LERRVSPIAIIGCFGALIFECSRRKVHTFFDLKVSNSARYAQHDVHLQTPILEFTGPGLSEVSFSMNFNKQWNADPFVTLTVLRMYNKVGVVAPLLVGNRPISLGLNLWVVTQVSEDHKFFTREGVLQGAQVNVSLKEYRPLL
jgi:phage protein U